MQDKVIEEVFNRLHDECAGDSERLKVSLGTFVKECIEAKQDREKKGRSFETDVFVDHYPFDKLEKDSRAVFENRDRIVALEGVVAANTARIDELSTLVEQLRIEANQSARFWSVFWKNYIAGVVVALTFPLLILIGLFVIALAFGIDFSPVSVASTVGEWLTRIGGE